MDDTPLETCSCCGGSIPEEGSPAWKHTTRKDGDCTGSVNFDGNFALCGGFKTGYRLTVKRPSRAKTR